MGDVVTALTKAEDFIKGFEDDENQEGIGELLQAIASAKEIQTKAEERLSLIANTAMWGEELDDEQKEMAKDARLWDEGDDCFMTDCEYEMNVFAFAVEEARKICDSYGIGWTPKVGL